MAFDVQQRDPGHALLRHLVENCDDGDGDDEKMMRLKLYDRSLDARKLPHEECHVQPNSAVSFLYSLKKFQVIFLIDFNIVL